MKRSGALLAATLLLGACSGSDDTPERSTPTTAVVTPRSTSPTLPAAVEALPDPCSLVTAADVARILELASEPTSTPATTPADKQCRWDGDLRVNLSVLPLPRAQFDRLRGQSAAGASCTSPAGIGDAAYACDSRALRSYWVGAYATDKVITVSASYPASGAVPKAQVLELAKFAIAQY